MPSMSVSEAMPEAKKAGVPNFSIVIIARNEQERIAKTLTAAGTKAHIDAGGDVLVADTGSDDNTCAVAEAHGARTVKLGPKHLHTVDQRTAKRLNNAFIVAPDPKLVEPGEKYFHFAAARNEAHLHAKCNMVLQIDTCDMLEVNKFEELSAMIASGVTRFTYWHYLGTGNERQHIARFYDRRIDLWSGMSHEALSSHPTPEGYINAQGQLHEKQPQVYRDIGSDILQVRYLRNTNKSRPYHIGMMLDCLEDPSSPRWFHYLGREFYYTKRWHSALKLLEHQTTMEAAWAPEKSQSWVHAGECYEALADMAKARANALRGFGQLKSRKEREDVMAQYVKARDDALAHFVKSREEALAKNVKFHDHDFMYVVKQCQDLVDALKDLCKFDAKRAHDETLSRFTKARDEAAKKYTKARLAYFEASFVDPCRREPWIRLAKLYQKLEKALPEEKRDEKHRFFQAGFSVSKAALCIPCVTQLSEKIENYEYIPHEMAAWGSAWGGQPKAAKYHWQMCCHYNHDLFKHEGIFYKDVKEDVSNTDIDGHALFPKPAHKPVYVTNPALKALIDKEDAKVNALVVKDPESEPTTADPKLDAPVVFDNDKSEPTVVAEQTVTQ